MCSLYTALDTLSTRCPAILKRFHDRHYEVRANFNSIFVYPDRQKFVGGIKGRASSNKPSIDIHVHEDYSGPAASYVGGGPESKLLLHTYGNNKAFYQLNGAWVFPLARCTFYGRPIPCSHQPAYHLLQRNSTFDLTGKPGGLPTRHALKQAIIYKLGWRRLWRSERREPRERADATNDFGWLAAYGGTKLTFPPSSGYNLNRSIVEHYPETTSIVASMACMQRHGLRNLGGACAPVGRRCVQLPEEVTKSTTGRRRDCCGLDPSAPTSWLSEAEADEVREAREASYARVRASAAEIETLRRGPGGMASVQARATRILEELYDVSPAGKGSKRESFNIEEGNKVAAEVDRLMALPTDDKGRVLPGG